MTDTENHSACDRQASPWLHVWDDEPPHPAEPTTPLHLKAPREAMRPGSLAPWWKAGARVATLKTPPDLHALQATPGVMALMVLTTMVMSLLWERLAIPGGANFDWRALPMAWFDLVMLAWVCAWVRPHGVGTARLICLALGVEFVIMSVTSPLWLLMAHLDWQTWPALAYALSWIFWLGPQLWWLSAMGLMFWRMGDRHWRPWLLAMGLLLGLLVLRWAAPPPRPWTQAPAAHEAEPPSLTLTEAVLDAQSKLLDRQLAALKPQRPGVADVYVLTFAPYGEEDVFSRESAMVADVMARRFDAGGREVQLVNHPALAEQLPWATSRNLERALQRVGQIMDPREDILFIHLTSHGARNGHLAAGLWPLKLDPVTPQALKAWMDHAGIRYRVISISACYSGSWIAPLSNDESLVMTAADADHTSYGCGRRSPLTFFGRAMYDEQLRTQTRSFTQAHAAAREVIRRREIEGGKDDGYSNPQIKLGSKIAPVLEALARSLAP